MGKLENYITVQEAAALSGYAEEYLRQRLRDGKIAGRKAGRTWLVDRADLLRYKAMMDALGTDKFDWRRGSE